MKSLYSLKQSTRVWNYKLQNHLLAHEYKQLHLNYSLFYNGKVLIVAYIDNLVMAGLRNLQVLKEAKTMLHSAFKMKDFGECKHFLRISIEWNPDGVISIEQESYIKATL